MQKQKAAVKQKPILTVEQALGARTALITRVTTIPKTKQMQRLSILLSPRQIQEQIARQKQVAVQAQKQAQISAQEQISLQRQSILQLQKPMQIQKPAQLQEQVQALTLRQDILLRQEQVPLQRVEQILRPRIILKPPTTAKEKIMLLKEKIKEKGYDVYVREGEKRGDKFRKVASNLPRNKALRRGKEITDRYIEASFRIQELKKKAKEADIMFAPDLSKFRRPKGKTKLPVDTYIEKVQHRIDTIGEKLGLKYFKERARKKKLLLGRLSNIMVAEKKKQIKEQQVLGFIASKQQSSFLKSKKKKGKPLWL